MTCADCVRNLKRSYQWEGRTLGIECWKRIALPAIEAERAKREEDRRLARQAKGEAIASVLRGKDLSKITNSFKLDFIPSIIEQVTAGRLLSNRQIEICFSFFNQADWVRMALAQVALGEIELEGVADTDRQRGMGGKLVKAVREEWGSLPQQVDSWGNLLDDSGEVTEWARKAA